MCWVFSWRLKEHLEKDKQLMASESMVPEQGKHTVTGKRHQKQERTPLNCDGEEDTFVFEANEAWKDFHSSLLHFYEAGELCDVTLKVVIYIFYIILNFSMEFPMYFVKY